MLDNSDTSAARTYTEHDNKNPTLGRLKPQRTAAVQLVRLKFRVESRGKL